MLENIIEVDIALCLASFVHTRASLLLFDVVAALPSIVTADVSEPAATEFTSSGLVSGDDGGV